METGATYFGSTNVPSSFEIPSHVYGRVCSSKWSCRTTNTPETGSGAQSASRGGPYSLQRGFHDLPILRLF